MHHNTDRADCAGRARRISVIGFLSLAFCFAAVGILCVTIYSHASVPQVRASSSDTGALSSSPSSGPTGTTISVSGSGWSQPDGTPVSFGYSDQASNCKTVTHVADSLSGSFNAGSFSGWLRWPLGTALGTYTVCATFSSTTYNAGYFTVLSTSSPQVSISPSALKENQKVTITASNYLPSGTAVTFYWATTSHTIVRTINSATSNSAGSAQISYTVPVTSLVSGQYLVEAVGGSGQQAPLFSSASFTYSRPTPTPSPTPSPTPAPTQNPTPTMTATVTATATPSATAGASPTAGTTPTNTTSQASGGATPTSGTTTTSGSGGSDTSSSQSNAMILIGAIVGSLVLLTALPAAGLMLRRKKQQQLARLLPSAPNGFPGPGQSAGLPMPGGASAPPGQSMRTLFPGNAPQNAPVAAMPVMAGQYAGWQPMTASNGFAAVAPTSSSAGYMNGNGQNGASGPATLPYRSLLDVMTPPQGGSWPQNSDGKAPEAPILVPADPALEAMRRQAQVGLYVAPMPRE